ncbi:MAG: hypothetical protein A3J29_19305 [Acidobacteria bacterium RIFCSPLOWO2_12_FULL_67_14b]|nr:MAG: hypothetical protein A3J29_19305 [Acidobacteria bacterium RIFCSPLOWO2_12_FULL_67_14b]
MATLATPGKIGSLTLPGRCVFAPILMQFATDRGEVTQRLVEFYRRLAGGGFALIVSECTFPQYKGGIATRGLALYDDRFVPGVARLAAAVHAEGARLAVQVFFDGAGRVFASDETVSIGPSDLAPFNGPSMRPMTDADIERMVADFASASRRAVDAGADLIELHMGHGHLLGRFVSPFWNRRDDAFGGSTDRRMRFPLMVVAAVREAVGGRAPITARLSMSERLDGGIEVPEAIEIGKRLKAAGIDGVHTTVGTGTTRLGLASIFPTSFAAEAPFASLASEFRQKTDLTTIFAGKVSLPETAERLLSENAADFISIGRAALADPDWPRHATRRTRYVPCIGCNQGCVDALLTRKEITCTVNPRVGFEGDFTTVRPFSHKPRFAVIGGGVAGIVAALGLAERQASVTLHEAAERLGGQYGCCERVPGKEQYGLYLAHLLERLSEADIDVRLGAAATAADVDGCEAVFWAGGAVPRPWDQGRLTVPVLSGWQCFDAPELQRGPQRVLVIGAGQVGLDAALWLAKQGHRVIVCDQQEDPLAGMSSRRHDYETAFAKASIALQCSALASGGVGGRVQLRQDPGGIESDVEVDAVVAAVGRMPRSRPSYLRNALAVGDANRVGTALDAIRQATFHAAFAGA